MREKTQKTTTTCKRGRRPPTPTPTPCHGTHIKPMKHQSQFDIAINVEHLQIDQVDESSSNLQDRPTTEESQQQDELPVEQEIQQRHDKNSMKKPSNKTSKQQKIKLANNRAYHRLYNRAYHRLLSIHYDVQRLQQFLFYNQDQHAKCTLPIIANERCGSWYAYPLCMKQHQDRNYYPSCYFKSTDGHVHVWNVSLKRLNLHLIPILAEYGRCMIIDSSVRKLLPDSFTRTIPIWACVINRIVQYYRQQFQLPTPTFWDTDFYTPPPLQQQQQQPPQQSISSSHKSSTTAWVSDQERQQILQIIPERVEAMLESHVIVHPEWLVKTLQKPIKPLWIYAIPPAPTPATTHHHHHHHHHPSNLVDSWQQHQLQLIQNDDRYYYILCCNPSVPPSCIISSNNLSLDCSPPSPPPHCHSSTPSTATTTTTATATATATTTLSWCSMESIHGQPFCYTPGAADDQESWARQLTPELFWKNQHKLWTMHCDDWTHTNNSQHSNSNNLNQNHNQNHKPQTTIEDCMDANIDFLMMQQHRLSSLSTSSTSNNRSNTSSDDPIDSIRIHSNLQLPVEYPSYSMDYDNNDDNDNHCYDWIGMTRIAIGTRRAGRPPNCWNVFDTILNVSTMEYPELSMLSSLSLSSSLSSSSSSIPIRKSQQNCHDLYYCQLPVQEGKRDKWELEHWLPVGIVYLIFHLQRLNQQQLIQDQNPQQLQAELEEQQHGERRTGGRLPVGRPGGILIHCAQGKDRSVAVAMAIFVLFANTNQFPMAWKDCLWQVDLNQLIEMLVTRKEKQIPKDANNTLDGDTFYSSSGLPHALVAGLLDQFNDRDFGRDILLEWLHTQLSLGKEPIAFVQPLATKERFRMILQWIRQDRIIAEPSRSTMQKLHRFFMSSPLYKKNGTCLAMENT